ncbi:MAG: hypothetical protein A3D34_00530 [Candidatus Staskawiczbacteria bacterium RIFCSPHIGHO2_02_FULL_33_16]|uniref:BioF2-like acetyltransferase domain-containing protein n=1 Tax=Candidatus Staskawiczbacteria bacterium RIFCSPHIGHO2_02_FULL_33_16 TaxID=1802204 RepID=A0A1G2HW96_9BACT|nr:MAG: hypothetical protein A3D34_00530 [Candidatus Staskawiczbacteria bacterium RIFCSPHIGHO2_02_FULL_33_16]OGZ70350.1 MAG: hypothetical protein A2980_01805 [Candidatus Staskawiczbacteria bacterium RIFCSPLOWO2_01_FULL_33_13]
MEIIEIEDKKTWENFLQNCQEKTFLQSWNWGEFQKSMDKNIWRFGIYDNEKLLSVALVIKMKAKRGSFLLVPHGPVIGISNFQFLISNQISDFKSQILKTLLEKLKIIAIEERVDFIRISPIWKRVPENEVLFNDLKFRLRPLHTHPESSWKLDISQPEQHLMDHMRKTTRYLVLKAQKDKNIEIIKSTKIEDIDIFNSMHLEVVKTQKFVPFSLEYFKKEFLAFLPDNQITIFFAKYKGQIIAASYEIFWSGIGFYHHAALLPEYKKIPVSYLLQWESIKEAKKRGCNVYDFWGHIDPFKFPKHPYAGPTLFKMGFGGYCQEYVKTQDLIISPKYWLNYIIELVRKYKRGL